MANSSAFDVKNNTFKACIDYGYPDRQFWDHYQTLWSQCIHPSAFQSPRFLQNLSRQVEGTLAVYKFYRNHTLTGAALFHHNGGSYTFLSDQIIDHNFFIIHKDCSPEEQQKCFELFFREVREKKWTLTLNNQPFWANYWVALEKALKGSRMYNDFFIYSVCPVLELESPEELYDRFSKSKNIKYYTNKVKKKLDASFEVYMDAEDLDKWIEEFTNAHIKRWALTNTPSKYIQTEQIELLKEALLAWIEDGLLIRFSIKTKGERIAFCLGLKEDDSLLYHAQTYDVSFGKYRLGSVLLGFVGKWAGEQGFQKFDFGDGDESYKYRFSNVELKLYRIFLAPYSNLPYIVKTKIIKAVRQNDKIYRLYLERIKPVFSKN